MFRKAYLSFFWVAGYLIIAGLISLSPWFAFFQAMILLLPIFMLGMGLCWTTPHPDYAATPELQAEPIHDLDPPARKIVWLDGWWDFRLPKDPRWHRFQVPRSWNTVRGLEHYEGKGLYRRLFTIPDDWSLGRIFLNFRGANYSVAVSIDGREVGRHEGGFTPFSFDITDRVIPGRQYELEVEVDNNLDSTTVPSVAGWRNEGGILREVYLETTREIYISDVTVISEPDLKGRCYVLLNVKVENPEWQPRDYHFEIFSPQGALVHEHKEEGWSMQQLEHSFEVKFVSLWTPDNPALYTCRVTMLGEEEDQYVTTFGVRKIELKENRFHLNGEALTLQGVVRIEDHLESGPVESVAAIKKDLQMIKDAGFNLVRLPHKPAHPRVLDMCDKLGLFVLQELPVWYGMSFDLVDPAYQKSAESQLREVIIRDRNHPCLIAWGLAAQIEYETQESQWFMEQLVKIAKDMDERPVYMVVGGGAEGDRCAELMDALVLTQWARSANQTPPLDEDVESWHTHVPDKPILTNFQGLAAMRGAALRWGGHWNEEKQAHFFQRYVKHFENHKHTAGWMFGTLADYRDPTNFAGPVAFMRLTGLTNHWREPKIAYDAARSVLVDKKEMALSPARRALPITSFTKIFAWAFLALAVVLWLKAGPAATALFYNPQTFLDEYASHSLAVLFIVMILNALAWAVLINRFFKTAPRRILGAIKLPYHLLISLIMRSEAGLFVWSFLTLGIIWTFSTTVLHLVFFPDETFCHIAGLSAALVVPDLIYIIPAFFRMPLSPAILLFHVWKAIICYKILGPAGMIVYVFVSPYIPVFAFFAFLEFKFQLLKYMRKMFKLQNPFK